MSDNSYTSTQSKIQALAYHHQVVSEQIDQMEIAVYVANQAMKRLCKILECLKEAEYK